MKLAVMILTFCGLVYGGFKIDEWVFHLIVDEIPLTEWLGVLKIVIGIVLFFLSAGFILGVSGFIVSIIGHFFQSKRKSFKQ